MKTNRILWKTIVAAALLSATARAAEGNRFLLVFETTKAMKRNMDSARLCAKDLLTSNFGGQAHPGDTLGVWTYDSELHAGIFPMQGLGADDETDLAQHLDDFLKQQRCNGNARFDQVLAELDRVVSGSDGITVLIFSDGYDPIQGTPFDASVNDVYTQHRGELRDAHIPFVTLLQARDGKIVRGTVNSAVGPIDIPALPPPPAPPKSVEPPAPVAVVEPATPAKTNPPLILDYSQAAARAKAAAKKTAAKSNDASTVPGVLASALSTITNIMNLGPAPKPTASAPAMVTASPVTSAATPPTGMPAANKSLIIVSQAAPAEVEAEAAPGPGRGGFILAGLGLLLALGGLAVLAFWRMRSAPRASVITESFNQTKK